MPPDFSSDMSKVLRLDLEAVEKSLLKVEKHWDKIDDELDRLKIGRKDSPFNKVLRDNMMSAYSFLDDLLSQKIEPFSSESVQGILELNNMVHYDNDKRLRFEYSRAMQETSKKFHRNFPPLKRWYEKHSKRGDHPLKIAAEIYVGILGRPQLFIEGNHRAGSIIASWIDMSRGYPPFILSPENAIAYFAPSAEIKYFADKSTWRGRFKLPKYRKSFRKFWEENIDCQYLSKKK